MINSFFASYTPLLLGLILWCITGNANINTLYVSISDKDSVTNYQLLLQIEANIATAKQRGDKIAVHQGYIALGKQFQKNNKLDDALIALNSAYVNTVDLGLERPKHEAIRQLSEVLLARELRIEAQDYLRKGLDLSIQLRDSSSIAWYYLRIVEVDLETGNLGQSMEMALKALTFFAELSDSINQLHTLLNLSSIHNHLGNVVSSQECLRKANDILSIVDDNQTKSNYLISCSQLKILQGKFTEANTLWQEAVVMLEEISPKETYRAKSLGGEINCRLKKYSNAQHLLSESIQNQQILNDQSGLALSYLRMANLHRALGELNSSLDYYSKSLSLAAVVGLTDVVRQAYKGLSQVNSISGNSEKAYRFLDNYTRITDSLFNAQKISEANKVEENAIHEQHLSELRNKETELEQFKGLVEQQKRNQILLATVTVLFFLILILSIREFLQKNKANELLVKQKAEIEHQKQLADRKTRNFTDSLNYSQRIQKAILRTSLTIQNLFPESFIILLPKDIVSGDFYWIKEKNERILFALADCTGHGVPGALMSIIGTFGLNQVVNELNITSPSEILTNINDIFRENLIRKESSEIFDGMDIAICCYNPKTNELMYSGANIPLHICRSNLLPQPSSAISAKGKTHTLFNVKPAKQNIGSNIDTEPFKNHSITLMEGDVIYLFSDGFADQFGGTEGRKFKSTQLYKLLVGITNLALEEQKMLLEQTFIAWKGDHTQLDDVSFMGIRI